MKWPYTLAVIAYCALIFWLSSQPISVPPALDIPHLDKAVHVMIYGVLAALVSVGMYRSGKNYTFRVQFYVPWAFATFYGITDEIHQLYVPGRHFEWLDIAANMTGAYLAQLFLCYVWWRLHKQGPVESMQLQSSEAD